MYFFEIFGKNSYFLKRFISFTLKNESNNYQNGEFMFISRIRVIMKENPHSSKFLIVQSETAHLILKLVEEIKDYIMYSSGIDAKFKIMLDQCNFEGDWEVPMEPASEIDLTSIEGTMTILPLGLSSAPDF